MASSLHPERIAAAERYIAADKSDPFTRARVYAHMRSGLAGIKNGEEAFYSADEFLEERVLPDGRTYTATAYRNLKRP